MSGEHEPVAREAHLTASPADPAHEAHGATRFEETDAQPAIVIWSLGIIAGTLIFVFAITVGIQRYLYNANPRGELVSPLAPERVLPPEPQLQVHPWDELPRVRAREAAGLELSGPNANGRMNVPIDHAMDAVVPGLNVRPGAPQGATTSGGEGRTAAQAAGVKPYQIEIRPEAQKHEH